MNTYEVRVTREGRWWMVAIPDLDGLTQARGISEAALMAREYIAVTTDQALDDVAVNVTVEQVGDVAPDRIRSLTQARADLDALSTQVAAETRAVAKGYVAAGVPVRDVGDILGVSHQRVAQLVNS